MAALQSKKTTAAQVKARFFAMGRRQVQIGRSFATLVPPKAAAKANRDFSHAEIVLGRQNGAVAKKLPTTKPAIVIVSTERRRSRTYPAWGYHASPVLKTP